MGEMISSVTFFGFGLWLIFQARDPVSSGSIFRTFGLYASGAFCVLAAFRFVIADFFSSFGKRRR